MSGGIRGMADSNESADRRHICSHLFPLREMYRGRKFSWQRPGEWFKVILLTAARNIFRRAGKVSLESMRESKKNQANGI